MNRRPLDPARPIGTAQGRDPAKSAARADAPIAGIFIGHTIAATIRDLGLPESVDSTDVGNVFAFAASTAFVDDDGTVRALETNTGAPTIAIEGTLVRFPIGTFTSAQADARFANIAEFSSDTLRSYRLSPQRELVLIFERATQRLAHVYYGERGPLARLGILPGDDINTTVPFRAPLVRGTSFANMSGALTTIVRLDLDARGNVTKTTVVVPSIDPAADATIVKQLAGEHYAPAQLGGRQIGGVVYREIHH